MRAEAVPRVIVLIPVLRVLRVLLVAAGGGAEQLVAGDEVAGGGVGVGVVVEGAVAPFGAGAPDVGEEDCEVGLLAVVDGGGVGGWWLGLGDAVGEDPDVVRARWDAGGVEEGGVGADAPAVFGDAQEAHCVVCGGK